jgi:hypothetical protein
MVKECGHFWLLDHEQYFNIRFIAMAAIMGTMVFPAKCHICKVERGFNKQQWLDHLGGFNRL